MAVFATPAYADTVNYVAAAGATTVEAGKSTSIGYNIAVQGAGHDGQGGCNAKDGSAATLSFSGLPTGITATPSTLTFDDCDVAKNFTFTVASTVLPKTYSIPAPNVADSGTGSYTATGAAFSLNVTKAAPVNTAPVVAVTGVANAATYEFGNVPVAGCSVSDTEDGSTASADVKVVSPANGLGSSTASCTYTDTGGLTGSASAGFTVQDTTKPEVTVPTADVVQEATAASTPVTFKASAYDTHAGELAPSCTPASGTGFVVGTTAVTCSATDASKNTGSGTFNVKVTDTKAPVLTMPANVVEAATSASGATVNYGAVSASDLVSGTITASCLPASGGTFALGTTTVTCSATDKALNKAEDTFTVTVQDKAKPDVTVPKDVVAEATSAGGAAVTYSGASATDDVDGTLPPTCDPVSGSTFVLGDTKVTCTATDKAGNVGSNSFTVTVQDKTAPTVTVPATITREATSSAGASVTYTGVSATDLVDGAVAPTCNFPADSEYALGSATVTCEATDKAGNKGQASFVIKVVDTTPPAVTTSKDVTAEATGPTGAKVNYDAATATDIVDGDVNTTCTPASGGQFPLGATIVTCEAKDNEGNVGKGSFKVNVVDKTAPKLTLPANALEEATSAEATTVNYGAATASDLVDGSVAVSCLPVSGSTFALGTTTVTCSATDKAGNTAQDTLKVTVQDTGKPDVTVPANITQEATGSDGAIATWTGVSGNDKIDGSLAATCDYTSGAKFPLGTTTVTCKATDKSGNTGSNTFTIKVQDKTAPTVSVPANIAVTATSAAGATVNYSGVSATDLVDGAVLTTCDYPSGSTFPLGTTTVTCSATDKALNTDTKSFTVKVTAEWSNYLQSINLDNSSVFKQGSTVPVKFQLTGASAGIKDLPARLRYKKLGSSTGTFVEAPSTVQPDRGNLFRYDPTSNQYIFNLNTKPLPAGGIQLLVDLGDGVTTRTVNITLK